MANPGLDDFQANGLLGMLREVDLRRLAPHALIVDLDTDTVLQAAGQVVVDTWFPCGSAMASFSLSLGKLRGAAVEVALIGREGAIGGIVSNGQIPSFATARVRNAGRFLQIKTSALEDAKLDSISLRHCFSRYSDCLLAQVFQTAACNATHTISQRVAKWLLASYARTDRREFDMTQDELALLLGAGRTFITRVVNRLRSRGVIDTKRGAFVIRDELALQAVACSCAAAIDQHFHTVLQGIYPT